MFPQLKSSKDRFPLSSAGVYHVVPLTEREHHRSFCLTEMLYKTFNKRKVKQQMLKNLKVRYIFRWK